MAIKGQRTRAPSMGLACELLARVGQTTCRIQDWKVEWRPLQYDAWDSTDDTAHMANCTGFDHSSTGGLEFKITRNLWKINTATSNKEGAPTVATYATATKRTTLPSVPFYMMIIPTFEPHQTIHALPLVVGPITIRKYPIYRSMISSISQNTTNAATNTTTTTTTRTTMATGYQQRHDKTGPISFDQIWMTTTGCYSQEMYRAFKVTTLDQYFIIKEGWNMGTPGKMWDSALVISDLFVQKIIEQPKCLEDCHLLDLSAGTGTAGLLISFLYQNMSSIYRNIKITLTDLPDALPLITYNQNLNRIKPSSCISVTPLSWGNKEDIQLVKKKAPIDIIIASDVLYEPMNFAALVLTLVDLSIPGRTVIYLGYKRRGLKEADERYFFGLCHEHFDIQTLGYDDDNTSDCNYTSHYNNNRSTVYDEEIGWEKRYGKLKKNKKRLDGEGWLGSFAQDWITKSNLDSIGQSYQQTGVHIYRLVRKLPAQVTTII
ncbi:putative methyltransferase-domain-containing protein [Halteromyces radiatus]|uniref:putative methyltransferase-domain-containing protein n=1 Tax=Halteromyces radiatus TaxID=101107 RepID=UPI00221F8222|nr:putative methyltransferase-domain-containing protein [Halteromyces radiatus]KAI8089510.1 putative methyltransferase-domain-containing protein [Halteromyces radiatus]